MSGTNDGPGRAWEIDAEHGDPAADFPPTLHVWWPGAVAVCIDLTIEQARELADDLHDEADRLEAAEAGDT